MRSFDIALGAAVIACMAFGELARLVQPERATIASMVGWVLLVAMTLRWLRDDRGWRVVAERLARITLLAGAAFVVLYLYYAHSHVVEAGVHVDLVYTYVGLEWFIGLHNPITFGARTFSYPQFPSMLLEHLPALMIGFDRLGPFAVQLGIMIMVALLLAMVTDWAVPVQPLRALATVVLVAAMFSNRQLVLAYNTLGYAPAAICLGLIFIVGMLAREASDADRLVGALLVAAMLHFYTGFVVVLPLVVAWLVLRRGGLARVRAFVAGNPVLVTVIIVFTMTVLADPELLLRRIVHVTTTTHGGTVDDVIARVQQHWVDTPGLMRAAVRRFTVENPGSWLLLDVPPLGGLELPILGVAWLAALLALPGRRVRFVVSLVLLAFALAVLTLAQHLMTDFMDYRDFTFVYALVTTGLLIAFRAPQLAGWRAACAWTLVVAVAFHNWVDVATLRGHRFLGGDYSPVSEGLLVRLTDAVHGGRLRALDVTRIYVVTDDFVALHWLYEPSFARAGLMLQLVPATQFCPDPEGSIGEAAASDCSAFLLVSDTRSCERITPVSRDVPDEVQAALYDSVCAGPEGAERAPESVSLAGADGLEARR
jgi:hypothetical protein